MANMTAKEWLSRARNARMRLKALEESKRRAYERATSGTRALRHDFTGLSGNFTSGSKSDSYAVLSAEVDRQKDEVNKKCAEVTRVIARVEDNILATLLTEYYVNGKTWSETAEVIHYSTRHVHKLHEKAVEAVQVILEELRELEKN